MANRFGGEFSPGGRVSKGDRKPAKPLRRARAGFRSNMLFVLPFAFLPEAFFGDAVSLALNLGVFFLLMLGAWLTREGLIAEQAYEARSIAKRPAIPRKIFASVLTGAGLALSALADAPTAIIPAVIFAVLGAGLHMFSFGLDPLKNKGVGDDNYQSERVARAVEEAEQRLDEMQSAIKLSADGQLVRRVAAFRDTAEEMLRAIENDPRDLTAARRYIGVYLEGARDATRQFADLYSRSGNAQARADYEALLDDLEASFAARTEKMLSDDKSSLDVEIDVLRERLAREGVMTKPVS